MATWKTPRLQEKPEKVKVDLLPAYLMAELEAMAVFIRGTGSETDAPVVYITTSGPTGHRIRYYSDTIEASVLDLWPELNAYQVHRVVRWINAGVRNALRESAQESPRDSMERMNLKRKRNWATEWKSPSFEDFL
ncbi:hypothetical protein EKL30_00305 [Candidimonas sp. SYP-B2681]|uniref:hypothetical protein n=1 Tax=Candidimonas sp. SYP-B2681 TaxID=2497686 RepID=UPI000F87E068|nr:hypothetical protein [Candidimonas sp. SYP-B2681]RTZ47492.1 hypothetical protein EKL30_00305 [Candidimonas sp. SYP-B2681]